MPFLVVIGAPELIRRAWRMDCDTIKGMALRQTVDDLLRWCGLESFLIGSLESVNGTML
jgi:hypothetical protein